jgi:hypothetical protein
MISRRIRSPIAAICLVSAAVAWAAARAEGVDPLSGEALYRDVERYVAFGEHRTGTDVDLATSAWIRAELAAAGFEVTDLPFPVRVFDMKSCWVKVGERSYEGYPEWYPTATGPEPVTAPLTLLGNDESLESLEGKVWLTKARGSRGLGSELKRRLDAAGKAGAVAAVVVIPHPSGELSGRSTGKPWHEAPWCSIPVVGVAPKHEETLRAAAERGEAASVLIHGQDRPDGRALTTVGCIGDGDELIIVTTPSSGLSYCGGERAPGVALLLGLARWVAQRRPDTRYLFSANSGHELMGLGVYPLMDEVPPPEAVKCWLHMGSGIANWHWVASSKGLERQMRRGGIQNFVCSPELVPIMERSFAHIEGLAPRTTRPGGELAHYMRVGYRSFGFYGGNRYVHTIVDRADQTAPELLEPVARGLARALEAIEDEEFMDRTKGGNSDDES